MGTHTDKPSLRQDVSAGRKKSENKSLPKQAVKEPLKKLWQMPKY